MLAWRIRTLSSRPSADSSLIATSGCSRHSTANEVSLRLKPVRSSSTVMVAERGPRSSSASSPSTAPANAIGSASDRSLYIAEVMVLLDHVIESAKIGLRKPGPRIYQVMVEKFAVHPKHCVYLDDLGVNLKLARETGMTTIKVLNAAQAIGEL